LPVFAGSTESKSRQSWRRLNGAAACSAFACRADWRVAIELDAQHLGDLVVYRRARRRDRHRFDRATHYWWTQQHQVDRFEPLVHQRDPLRSLIHGQCALIAKPIDRPRAFDAISPLETSPSYVRRSSRAPATRRTTRRSAELSRYAITGGSDLRAAKRHYRCVSTAWVGAAARGADVLPCGLRGAARRLERCGRREYRRRGR
jgi:hypothetical protein